MASSIIVLLLAASAQAPAASPIRQSAVVEIRVTDRSGTPLESARVTLVGVADPVRQTDASGRVTFRNVRIGAHTARVERRGFVPLDKEFTVDRGGSATVMAALSSVHSLAGSSAPLRAGPAGNPSVLSIPDFVEKQYIGQEAVKESLIGCSGATEARVIQVREPLMAHAHANADEMMYVIAGEGTLRVGEQEQRVTPGWLSMIPRGTAHSLRRHGRNPVILLSLLGGQPCAQAVARAGAGR